MSATWLLAFAIAWQGQDDAKSLVTGLSSSRSADRERAEQALIALGDASLPALAEVADTTDLELRAKVASLRDSIEGARLIRATRVKIDLDAIPPKEAAIAIGKQAAVTLIVFDDAPVRPGDKIVQRAVTIHDTEPTPLWDVLDQFAFQAELKLEPPLNPMLRQRQVLADQQGRRRRILSGNELVFRARDATPYGPASDWGAIRTSLVGLRLDRSRNFARTPESASQPEASSRFSVTLQVRGEPKIRIAAVDEARVEVAIDDRGQTLLPVIPSPPTNFHGQDPMRDLNESQPLVILLTYPQDPAASIVRMKGTYRALVVGRRDSAIRIPMSGSVGKTFTGNEASITIHQCGIPAGGRDVVLDFSVSSSLGVSQPGQFFNPNDLRTSLRPPPAARGQIEFIDAQGRTCQVVDLATSSNGRITSESTQRHTLIASPVDGAGPPIEARYYAPTWSTQTVSFEFRDVPMP